MGMPSLRSLVLFSALLPGSSWAQQTIIGPSLSAIVGAGNSVSGPGCSSQIHFAGPGVHGARRLRGAVGLEFAARGFWFKLPFSCMEAIMPLPPTPDGTYIVNEPDYLQTRPFITTDARVGVDLLPPLARVSGGAGMAWREGHNVPYVVAAFGLPSVDVKHYRFGLQLEYQWVRVAYERHQRTYQNDQIVTDQLLGVSRHWSHVVTAGVRIGIGLGS